MTTPTGQLPISAWIETDEDSDDAGLTRRYTYETPPGGDIVVYACLEMGRLIVTVTLAPDGSFGVNALLLEDGARPQVELIDVDHRIPLAQLRGVAAG